MGGFSVFMTFLLGIKFIVRPVMTTRESMLAVSAKKRAVQSLVCGVLIGFICGFIGAGGGMMMLLILTSVLGYELKTAVGTSVFIMAFTALTGAVSHFVIGGLPDLTVWALCVVFTLLWAQVAAAFANRAQPKTLTRPADVQRTFQRLRLFIAPGGLLVFDVNTAEKLSSLDGQVFLDETEDTYCVWRTEYRRGLCTYFVDLFRLQSDGAWDRQLEIHRQRAYTVEELTAWLKAAGFADIRIYGDMVRRSPREGEQRIYFTAIRK